MIKSSRKPRQVPSKTPDSSESASGFHSMTPIWPLDCDIWEIVTIAMANAWDIVFQPCHFHKARWMMIGATIVSFLTWITAEVSPFNNQGFHAKRQDLLLRGRRWSECKSQRFRVLPGFCPLTGKIDFEVVCHNHNHTESKRHHAGAEEGCSLPITHKFVEVEKWAEQQDCQVLSRQWSKRQQSEGIRGILGDCKSINWSLV